MNKDTVINISAFDIEPGSEGDFFSWYDEIHIPMLLKFPGLRRASRAEIREENDQYPRFLTFFELEDEEAFAAYLTSPELRGAHRDATVRSSEKGDRVGRWRVQYRVKKTWTKEP